MGTQVDPRSKVRFALKEETQLRGINNWSQVTQLDASQLDLWKQNKGGHRCALCGASSHSETGQLEPGEVVARSPTPSARSVPWSAHCSASLWMARPPLLVPRSPISGCRFAPGTTGGCQPEVF